MSANETTTETAPVVIDGRTLAMAPVDALAGIVILLSIVAGVTAFALTVVAIVVGLVAFVIWAISKPVGLIAFVVPMTLVGGYGVWMGAFYASIISLDSLGVRIKGKATYAALALAPALAPTVGALAGLSSIGRSASGRPVLAIVGAVLLVALGVVIGRNT